MPKKLLTLSTTLSTEKVVENPIFDVVINIINRLLTGFGVFFEKLSQVCKRDLIKKKQEVYIILLQGG